MPSQSAPVISLQAPKDVSLSEINSELSKIWQSYNAGGDGQGFTTATRASTFSLIVYEPAETQHLLTALGYYSGPIDGINGPRMQAALHAAQQIYQLPTTPYATPDLLAKLRQALVDKQQISQDLPIPQQFAADSSAGVADMIASQNPCRVIALCPEPGADEGVTAQVSAYCPVQKQSRSTLICCEYITLRGTEAALERVATLVRSLTIGGLPKFVWWKTSPNENRALFDKLAAFASTVVIDSSQFLEAKSELLTLSTLMAQGINLADLNWRRLAAWQELTAEAFDPPERRSALVEVDRVTLDYEKGNPAQALMFLGWLASRLQWQPTHLVAEGGDYDILRVTLTSPNQRTIEAELAAIPVASAGEVMGDLIDLKLASTNLNADCCTVLCSETGGCMRMEASGGAQACRVQQVTPLVDQKAETLLSQQLQRWGRDALYAESLAVTADILTLAMP
ncbi:glucose-6-phosphate dehydrogenase assembly protein OpcA [Synechococcales cyanobacterium C]|uniref:Glucose-6-phosphate dehydrogenase assembly protein OpcA n=1 Tax=Petrachloros mirabilis ULC683 TaxID=2781853 RepID=A0A8K2AGY3_9CYAN|nr:glucose-6-phosphate dehydrogenase assembly protein OpcA [Petrachloros mirabilis]NCJ05734.1 glucose-6-phosphate dehydrogenase assembly protein OpcA [Petrachloros mirabilis ULC683]